MEKSGFDTCPYVPNNISHTIREKHVAKQLEQEPKMIVRKR